MLPPANAISPRQRKPKMHHADFMPFLFDSKDARSNAIVISLRRTSGSARMDFALDSPPSGAFDGRHNADFRSGPTFGHLSDGVESEPEACLWFSPGQCTVGESNSSLLLLLPPVGRDQNRSILRSSRR